MLAVFYFTWNLFYLNINFLNVFIVKCYLIEQLISIALCVRRMYGLSIAHDVSIVSCVSYMACGIYRISYVVSRLQQKQDT